MKKVALYVRVSTQEQKKHGLSVDSQIVALRQYCKENGYKEAGIYNDAGISARKKYTKRPALLQLLNDCKAGKIDLILFTKLDRWFRSVGDYYEVQKVLDECKVPWQCIWEDYETITSSGVFKVNIMLSVAQSEADRTSERIKSTFEYKRSNGDYVGSAPYGYIRHNNQLVKNPEQSEYVALIFDTYLKTHSTTACVRKAYEAGASLSRSGISRILRSETYTGNAYGTKCEPYVSWEDHLKILEIIESNYRVPKKNTTHIYSRLCVCGLCGRKMRVMATTCNGLVYSNYFCTGIYSANKMHESGFSISENKIERYLLNELNNIVEKYNSDVDAVIAKTTTKNHFKKRQELEEKLKRIGIRFELGDISVEEYKEKRKVILAELTSLVEPASKERITLPDNWKDIYASLDKEHKQEFWFSIIKTITLYPKMEKPPVITFN